MGIANTPESGTAGAGDCAAIVIGIDPPETCMSGAVGVSGVFTAHEPGVPPFVGFRRWAWHAGGGRPAMTLLHGGFHPVVREHALQLVPMPLSGNSQDKQMTTGKTVSPDR